MSSSLQSKLKSNQASSGRKLLAWWQRKMCLLPNPSAYTSIWIIKLRFEALRVVILWKAKTFPLMGGKKARKVFLFLCFNSLPSGDETVKYFPGTFGRNGRADRVVTMAEWMKAENLVTDKSWLKRFPRLLLCAQIDCEEESFPGLKLQEKESTRRRKTNVNLCGGLNWWYSTRYWVRFLCGERKFIRIPLWALSAILISSFSVWICDRSEVFAGKRGEKEKMFCSCLQDESWTGLFEIFLPWFVYLCDAVRSLSFGSSIEEDFSQSKFCDFLTISAYKNLLFFSKIPKS